MLPLSGCAPAPPSISSWANPRASASRARRCEFASVNRQSDQSSFFLVLNLPSKKLPARLGHAGNFALQREPAETDSAHPKPGEECARAPANSAAAAAADLEFGV